MFVLSDVAGGYSASMLDAVRRARDTSKVLTIQNPNYNTLTFEEVFRLATLGGSQGKNKEAAVASCLSHFAEEMPDLTHTCIYGNNRLKFYGAAGNTRVSFMIHSVRSLVPGWPDGQL